MIAELNITDAAVKQNVFVLRLEIEYFGEVRHRPPVLIEIQISKRPLDIRLRSSGIELNLPSAAGNDLT